MFTVKEQADILLLTKNYLAIEGGNAVDKEANGQDAADLRLKLKIVGHILDTIELPNTSTHLTADELDQLYQRLMCITNSDLQGTIPTQTTVIVSPSLPAITTTPVAAKTSDVTLVDYGTPICYTPNTGGGLTGLNSHLKGIDDQFCTIKNVTIKNLSSSFINDIDATFTPSCFTFAPTSLNDALTKITDQICIVDDKFGTLNCTQIAITGAAATPTNYTAGAAILCDHLIGIDNKLGTLQTCCDDGAPLTVLDDTVNDIVNTCFTPDGGDATTSPVSLLVTIDNATIPNKNVYFIKGRRTTVVDTSGITMQATRDNYLDIKNPTTPVYVVKDVPIGNPAPAIDSDAKRIYKFVTDGSGVTATTDLRSLFPICDTEIGPNCILTTHIKDANVTNAKLDTTGVTAATYTFSTVTVNAEGRITSASSGTPAGESDASTTVKGVTKLSVAPVSPTNPIAVGDNDTRLLTAVNKTDLTDAGDSILHFHAADRARANHTGTQLASTISDFDAAVDSTALLDVQLAAASGVCPLDVNSLIPTIHLPPLAIVSSFEVASEAAHLALTTQEGDLVVRTDQSKTYVRKPTSTGTITDYRELLSDVTTIVGTSIINVSETPTGTFNLSISALSVTGAKITNDTIDSTKLVVTGVTAATYGDATNVGQFTVDAKGRITSAVDVPITGISKWTAVSTDIHNANAGKVGVGLTSGFSHQFHVRGDATDNVALFETSTPDNLLEMLNTKEVHFAKWNNSATMADLKVTFGGASNGGFLFGTGNSPVIGIAASPNQMNYQLQAATTSVFKFLDSGTFGMQLFPDDANSRTTFETSHRSVDFKIGASSTAAIGYRFFSRNAADSANIERFSIGNKVTDANNFFTNIATLGVGFITGFDASATNTIGVENGTAPGTSPANVFQLYAADTNAIAATSSAHIRSEKGDIFRSGNFEQQTLGVLDNANKKISNDNKPHGLMFVTAESNPAGSESVAIYAILGAANVTQEISDGSGLFSITKGTASSINIYYEAGSADYRIENKTGATVNFEIMIWKYIV